MAEASDGGDAKLAYTRYQNHFGKQFIDSVKYALGKTNYDLTPKFEQLQAIYELTVGKDVFVNLSTGFGKSLIYTLFPYVCDYMRSADGKPCSSSILVLISPLVSLMDDQLSQMSSRGISAVKLTDLNDTELNALKVCCLHKFLIVSPEGFQSEAIRSILKDLKNNIMCVAVDEAHCIEQWGRDFRTAYNDLREIRALLMPNLPMLALTATASGRTRNYLISKLDMEGCCIVKSSSNRPNIFYSVVQLNKEKDEDQLLDSCFGVFVEQLLHHKDKTERTIFFCTSTEHCATIFEYFEQGLADKIKYNSEYLVNMYVKITDEETKKDILKKFSQEDGPLRIVICTSAFGMGVDCPNVRHIIHYRSPSNLMQFMQESGRAGRDSKPSKSTIYYSSKEFGHYKAKLTKSSSSKVKFEELETMKEYCQNTSVCRRFLLIKYFETQKEAHKICKAMELHDCCDICSSKCVCQVCASSSNLIQRLSESSVSCSSNDENLNKFSEQKKKEIKRTLVILKKSLGEESTDSLFSKDKLTGFTDNIVDQVLDHCNNIFTIQDVFDNTDVWFEQHATAILDIITDARAKEH